MYLFLSVLRFTLLCSSTLLSRSQTWRDQNPTWQYKLWTDEDNRNLVAHHYSWLLNAYDNLPSKIMKADIVRNLYMHRHGGVYSDLDTVAMQPMDELFRSLPAERSAVLARMSDDEAFEHNIPVRKFFILFFSTPRPLID